MLQTIMSIVPACSFVRQRRRIPPLDEFFVEGNLACFQGSKQVANDLDELLEDLSSATVGSILCTEKGCSQSFPNNRAFDYHYVAFHKYRCKDCKANFPSDFLLELHLEENHDPLFEQKLEMGQIHYRCVCDGCTSVFVDKEQRNAHVIEEHKYPSDFRFNKLKTKHGHKQKPKDSMDVDLTPTKSATNSTSCISNETEQHTSMSADIPRQVSYKKTAPKSICFGRGTERGFHRPRGTKRGGIGRGRGRQAMMED